MANSTTNLNLFKYDTEQDANDTFNIDTALNENWDKIDSNFITFEVYQENVTITKPTAGVGND